MGQRELDPRLKALFDAKKKVYSISKLNTIDQCEYQAYLSYVKHAKQSSSCYSILGTRIHDCLEAIMNGESTEAALLPALNKELEDMDMLGIDFPNDRNGGTSIRDNWIADMKDFCTGFVKPKGKFETEQLFIYKIDDDHYIQGYIDLIRENKDGTVSIFDWKTSSQFTGNHLLSAGRQLILYMLGMQQQGIKVNDIAWVMLKYAEISFMGKARKNSKSLSKITKICNRRKIIDTLYPYLENDLTERGYSEIDIDIMLSEVKNNNSIKTLPKEIQNKYIIKPYVRHYEITPEIIDETMQYVMTKIRQFESKNNDDESDWHSCEINQNTAFFCNCLCGHSKHCKYITEYNKLRSSDKEYDDLF